MSDVSALDRPIWSALQSGWAEWAVRNDRAARLCREFGPFAAAADLSQSSADDLWLFLVEKDELWLAETIPPTVPTGAALRREAVLQQMVATSITEALSSIGIVPLGEADAPEMIALAHLTKPGPFAAHTHRLGRFVGVKKSGKLVAMAGERMRFPGFVEVSGVCTHPDHRGQGYAAALMRDVGRQMLKRGETPFLHCYADNQSAITLYESLGFQLRRPVYLRVITA